MTLAPDLTFCSCIWNRFQTRLMLLRFTFLWLGDLVVAQADVERSVERAIGASHNSPDSFRWRLNRCSSLVAGGFLEAWLAWREVAPFWQLLMVHEWQCYRLSHVYHIYLFIFTNSVRHRTRSLHVYAAIFDRLLSLYFDLSNNTFHEPPALSQLISHIL